MAHSGVCKVELVPSGIVFSDDEEKRYKKDYPNRTRWSVELRITQDSFTGNFSMLVEYDTEENVVSLGSEYSITLDELKGLKETVQKSERLYVSISMDGDDDYSETLNLFTDSGKLWVEFKPSFPEHGGFNFKLQISRPVHFLECLWEQISSIASGAEEEEEEDEE
jgi:hypothetical protein